MKVYTYVIATDRGSAPNYDPPFTTLAICKPRIRLGAEPRDFVLAFTGSKLSPERHAVCWAGIVTEKLTFSEYWADPRFATKKPGASVTPDNIYRPTRNGLHQVPNSSHVEANAPTDVSGQFVLTFDPAWVFGPGGPVLPERFGLRMAGGRRNHRTWNLSEGQAADLVGWLNGQGSPTTRPKLRNKSIGALSYGTDLAAACRTS